MIMSRELKQVLYGMRLAWNGLQTAWHNPVVNRAQSRSIVSMVVVLAIVYVVLLLW
jgi:hypothetical protein